MKFRDYYSVLGVSRTATQDEIKRAYRRLARKFHPDVSKEADAEERFKEVQEAYEVLKDRGKRAAYDQLGVNWKAGQEFTPPPGWDFGSFGFGTEGYAEGHAGAFSEFFEALFGRGPHAGARVGRGGFRMRGEDQYEKILITLEEAYHGATRILKLAAEEVDGYGRVIARSRELKVKIPPGVTERQQIRLANQGTPGFGGAPPGDLYLIVQFQPHRLFRAKGRDVYLTLPVAPWEAALGTTVTVPILGGEVDLKIPPGSQSGQRLRLQGRGLPGKVKGDQYVKLQIVTPRPKSEAERSIYRQMARAMPFNPRAHLAA